MKIVFFGDSNTWGFESGTALRQKDRFVRRIAQAHPEWEIVEEGLNGRTLAHDDPYSLPRNGSRQIDETIRSHAPYDVLVIMLGTNDAKRMFSTTPGRYENSLHHFLEEAVKPSLFRFSPYEPGRILLVQPPKIAEQLPPAEMETFGQEGIDLMRNTDEIYDRVSQFFDVDVLKTDLEPSPVDGLHLDGEGHRKLAEQLLPVLEQMERELHVPAE